jgi:predicted RNase H-like HicB family nuclease
VDVELHIKASPDGGFIAFNDDLRVVVQAETKAGAEERFQKAVRDLVQFCFDRRLPLPEALTLA